MKKIIADNTKVILSGKGGDEVFLDTNIIIMLIFRFKITNQVEKLNSELKKWKELTNEDLTNDMFKEKYLKIKFMDH